MHSLIFYITEEQIDSSQRLSEDDVYVMLKRIIGGLDYVAEIPNISDPDMKEDLEDCMPYKMCLRGSRLILSKKRKKRFYGSDMIVITSQNTWGCFEDWIKTINPNKIYFLNQWYDYHI